MTRAKFVGIFLGSLFFLASGGGCGRSPVNGNGVPGPRVDGGGRYGETAPRVDALRPDSFVADRGISDSGPCATGCVESCKLLVDCGLFATGPMACLKACPTWKPATVHCLDGVVCAPQPSCDAAKACILSPPPLPDLRFKDVRIVAKGSTVDYRFQVCNAGGGVVTAAFDIDLFWDTPTFGAAADWTMTIPSGLPPGACGPAAARRTNTPDGVYQTWIQIDAKKAVLESDENNNLVGPFPVTVASPKLIDLVVKRFDAKVSGSDINYEIEICNDGTSPAGFFRVDLFYNSVVAPFGVLGDQSLNFFSLAAGACKVDKRTYAQAPVGTYRSWVKIDALNTIPETNENNNVAGPKQVQIKAAPGCNAFCNFAIGCGEFKPWENSRCLTWCSSFDTTERACADSARKNKRCADLAQCKLPPKPPGPPPPTACLTICDHLINTCQLLKPDQRLTCIAGCATLPETKKQCALDAKDQGQCLAMMTCIL